MSPLESSRELIAKVTREMVGVYRGATNGAVAAHIEYLRRTGLETPARVVEQMYVGGSCIHCGRPWREVKVENVVLSFSYFEPDCGCYVRCGWCGHVHIEEREREQSVEYCDRCKRNVKTRKFAFESAEEFRRHESIGAREARVEREK